MKSVEDSFSDYKKVLGVMERHELANEFLAYKTKSDKKEVEYKIIDNYISSLNFLGINNRNWAKKYKMTKTDIKSLNFYNILNKRALSPEFASPKSLRVAIFDAFHYSSLKDKNRVMKDETGNVLLDNEGNLRMLKIDKNLENCYANRIRSFSMGHYYLGESVAERLGRK